MLKADPSHRPDVHELTSPVSSASRPTFKLKGPPFSIRMVGMVGNLCVAIGLVVFVVGLGLAGEKNVSGLLIVGWSLLAIIGGIFYIAAYHVAVAVLDMRNMMKATMER